MAKKKRKPRQAKADVAPGTSTTIAERPRSARSERKELVRQEREETRKREARRRVIRGMTIYTVAAVALATVVLYLNRPKPAESGPLPGMLTGEAPWPANTGRVGDRVDRLGLPGAGDAMHIHTELQIFVNGTLEWVPGRIGLATGVESPLHTHGKDGVIHVESETVRTFTLGDFFDLWGVRLTNTCLGGYCDVGSRWLRAYVNGELVQGSPRAIELEDQSVVVLTFGTTSEEPNPIPSTYDWSTLTP
ncbi:MAG: hypothetical protein AB1551_05000 [Actinomycetota bacterium]